MTKPIHYSELERLLADDNTPDEQIAPYLKPASLRALPMAPIVTVDETKVLLPASRGIVGLSVKHLNDRANRKRLAAYETRIRDGWNGLKLLAEGDSWFLYPILLKDIIDNLSNDHAVYSVAAAGDTLENMLRGTAELAATIKKHGFHGLLLSAGGNDIAGDPLASYLVANPVPKAASSYLNDQFGAFIGSTREKLDGLFGDLLGQFPDLKIFCHGYDHPFPRKLGLWLEPAMAGLGVPGAMQVPVLRIMIDRYYEMLNSLVERYRGRVFVVDCRGSVGAIGEWFDELHPRNPGYTRAADRFRGVINKAFGIVPPRQMAATAAVISWHPKEGAAGARGSKEFDLGSVVTVGRRSGVDIVIDDERISRQHVRLEVRQGNVVFTDLNTTNGTILDGRRHIGATIWRPGQKLRIGDHELEVAFGRSAAPGPILSRATSRSGTAAKDDAPAGRASKSPAAAVGETATGPGTGLRRLELSLSSGSIADVSAPAYVVGAFEHINPTSGGGVAVAIDDKLGGMLSTMVQAQMFESRLGEISLIPVPHNRSLTGLIAFAGLGPIDAFSTSVLEIVGQKLAVALVDARINEFATVPVGTGSGLTVRDFLGCFLSGLMRGLASSTQGEDFRRITVCEIDPDRNEAIANELKTLTDEGAFAKLGFEIVLANGEAQGQPARRGAEVAAARTAELVYLQVQCPTEATFEYCVLSAEFGAAIRLHRQTIDIEHQAQAANLAAKLQEFDATSGSSLASLYIPPDMRDLICRSLARETAHLVIVHDQASSTIPWEAFYFGERCPALDVGLSRLYRVASRGRGRAILAQEMTLRMLVVENPTGDLAGAQSEGDQLAALYEANRGKVKTLRGAEATRANVLAELSSGVHDILHYAGHADFEESSPEASGLVLCDGRLTAGDLLKLDSAPQMIFLNACESGRMRGAPGEGSRKSTFASHVSLAEGFLLNGIANFIGTYWPVSDIAASQFATTFYAGLLAGKPLSLAMREARQVAKSVSPRDWANYLHFGDPLYVLRRA